jgi:hypothetical protein
MPRIARIILCGFIGAVVCATLSFFMSFLVMVFDNVKPVEAFGYGLVVGMIGAFIGVIIGLTVGIGDLGVIGGGVAGLLGTLIGVAIYVYSTAENSGQYGYYLRASGISSIKMYVPTVLTGVITALLKNLISKSRGRTLSPHQN